MAIGFLKSRNRKESEPLNWLTRVGCATYKTPFLRKVCRRLSHRGLSGRTLAVFKALSVVVLFGAFAPPSHCHETFSCAYDGRPQRQPPDAKIGRAHV